MLYKVVWRVRALRERKKYNKNEIYHHAYTKQHTIHIICQVQCRVGIQKSFFYAFNVEIYAAIFMITLLDKLLSIKVHHALKINAFC